ncbi:Hypp6099 [Branchiostoma lanceolatum]|uniref:Hypp6099 protein n=1 Tax=Branchiostoma lanceolatum TaxID=7740 RepID=A0A8J9YNM9_BRALA|nr:Hypp6099 [Branchiostoma lanceolatum]
MAGDVKAYLLATTVSSAVLGYMPPQHGTPSQQAAYAEQQTHLRGMAPPQAVHPQQSQQALMPHPPQQQLHVPPQHKVRTLRGPLHPLYTCMLEMVGDDPSGKFGFFSLPTQTSDQTWVTGSIPACYCLPTGCDQTPPSPRHLSTADQTWLLPIGQKHPPPPPVITVGPTQLEVVEYARILGIILKSNLKWTKLVEMIVGKGSKRVGRQADASTAGRPFVARPSGVELLSAGMGKEKKKRFSRCKKESVKGYQGDPRWWAQETADKAILDNQYGSGRQNRSSSTETFSVLDFLYWAASVLGTLLSGLLTEC